MRWISNFEFDTVNDVVWADFQGVELLTPEDALKWSENTRAQLARLGRKVDIIISLDGLVVRAGAARSFGQLRAEILKQFARHSIRYGGDALTRTLIFTTSVRDDTHGDTLDSRQEALEALRKARLVDRA